MNYIAFALIFFHLIKTISIIGDKIFGWGGRCFSYPFYKMLQYFVKFEIYVPEVENSRFRYCVDSFGTIGALFLIYFLVNEFSRFLFLCKSIFKGNDQSLEFILGLINGLAPINYIIVFFGMCIHISSLYLRFDSSIKKIPVNQLQGKEFKSLFNWLTKKIDNKI